MSRIQQIISRGNFITCPHCHKSYLPLSGATEAICPLCDKDLDALLDLELLEIEELENNGGDDEL